MGDADREADIRSPEAEVGAMRRFSLGERQRKFAREVGSVVLGVLIALGLGEIATGIRWRFDAAEARSAMLTDFERDAGVMHERTLARRCIERRLGDVDRLIRQARQSGELPLVGIIGRPPTIQERDQWLRYLSDLRGSRVDVLRQLYRSKR